MPQMTSTFYSMAIIFFFPVTQNNHHEANITAKMKGLRGKVSDLEKAAAQRKAKLDENSAFLQFNWKADVVESWIGMFCAEVQYLLTNKH